MPKPKGIPQKPRNPNGDYQRRDVLHRLYDEWLMRDFGAQTAGIKSTAEDCRVERTIIKLGSASTAVRSGASRFPLKRDWWRLKGYDAFYGVYSRRAATWIHISDSRPKSRRRTHVQVRRPTCIMDTDTRRLNE